MKSKESTCCFTWHRTFSPKKIERIIKKLNEEIDRLIRKGVTNFISGGAMGFDQIAASMVIGKKQQGIDIRLILALPCRNQDEKWTDRQRQLYRSLIGEADEVKYISDEYTLDCMKERNQYMVDNSAYCICELTRPVSGTAQPVRYAKLQGLEINNVAK